MTYEAFSKLQFATLKKYIQCMLYYKTNRFFYQCFSSHVPLIKIGYLVLLYQHYLVLHIQIGYLVLLNQYYLVLHIQIGYLVLLNQHYLVLHIKIGYLVLLNQYYLG